MNDKISGSRNMDSRTLEMILRAQKGDQEAQNTLVERISGLYGAWLSVSSAGMQKPNISR